MRERAEKMEARCARWYRINSKQFREREIEDSYAITIIHFGGGRFDMRMKYWGPASGYVVRFHYVEIEK